MFCGELLLGADEVVFDNIIVVVSCYLGQMGLSLMPHCCTELLLEADGIVFDEPLL